MFKKILVPLDGSDLAESVLPHVRALAKCTGAEVSLLRVVSLPVSAYMVAADPRLAAEAQDEAEIEALSYLWRIGASVKADGIQVSTDISNGMIAETIHDFAKNIHADLIAMSTHGRGGLARLVIGSVADQVVRNSQVPLLLVLPQQGKN